MKAKNNEREEVIVIGKWPPDYAVSAYKKKHYTEAIQVVHGFIENKLQEYLIITGSIDYHKEMSEIWDIANQISLINCVKVLHIIGQLTKKEYQDILKFNSMRNQVVHRLFNEPYDQPPKGISKKEYDIVFNKGIAICDILQSKIEAKVG